MDLHRNIESFYLRGRRKEAAYEQLRVQLADDIRKVIAEKGIDIPMLAELLNFTESETRQRVASIDLRLSQLVDILDVLDLEPCILFRIRKGAIVK